MIITLLYVVCVSSGNILKGKIKNNFDARKSADWVKVVFLLDVLFFSSHDYFVF